MSRISRRTFVAGGAAAASAVVTVNILPGRARAAEFQLKYANNTVDTHPMTIRMREAVAKIKDETKGRVEIEVFPNNQLGGDTDMLSQVRTGAIDFFTLSGLILATLVPVASINGIGFAFKDYDQVWPAMDGELGAHVRARHRQGRASSPSTRCGTTAIARSPAAPKPIATPDDFKGFKIRVPVSPLWTSMFKAFGASPASINFSEVYSALQTKIVEGQENPLSLIQIAKLYEVQKYCSLTNHMWDGFWFLANGKMWAALPKDLQDIVTRNINEAALKERADLAELNATVAEDLKTKGMVFNTPDAQAFRDALKKAGFYEEWKGKYGPEAWALLEKYTGSLA